MTRKREWKRRTMPETAQHGRYTTYNNYGCRCEPCREARRQYVISRGPEYRKKKSDSDRARVRDRKKEAEKARVRRYGVTPEMFAAMLAQQDQLCAICRDEFGARGPHVDHDHACCGEGRACSQCVRGLLCWKCNSALGKFKDDPEILLSAHAYVTRYSRIRRVA